MSYPFIFERKNVDFLAIDSETVVRLDDISWVTTYFKLVRPNPYARTISLYGLQIQLKNSNTLTWIPTGFEGLHGWADRRDIVKNMATKINRLLQSGPKTTTPATTDR